MWLEFLGVGPDRVVFTRAVHVILRLRVAIGVSINLTVKVGDTGLGHVARLPKVAFSYAILAAIVVAMEI